MADHWFMQVEKVLEAMEITFNTTRIRLAAFQLEGEAQVWWKWARTSRDLEAMTWAEFQKLFMGKYFPDTARHAKAQEFLELKQGTMNVMEYVARFTELACFADDYVATDLAKVRRFENGLKLSIRGRIVGLRLWDMDSMVGTALTIERERSKMLGALGMRVLVARGRISLLLVRGRGRRLLLHTSFRNRARIGHVRQDCPHRQGSQDFGTTQSQLAVEWESIRFIPPHPSMCQRN